MRDDVFQKRDIGLHAANAEFAQRAVDARQSDFKSRAADRQFHQERIVKRRDDRAGCALRAVETNAQTGGAAISENLSVIRRETLFRVFGRDARLNRETDARDLVLRRNRDFRVVQFVALRDKNLRAHQVHAGDLFRHGMLDLDARVHLDEKPFVGIDIEQKFHGSGVVVLNRFGEFNGGFAKLGSHTFVEVHGWRNFNHFLMAALNRTIALVQVEYFAVTVAQNLHFDVLGARHVAFEENTRIAEGTARFALRFIQ